MKNENTIMTGLLLFTIIFWVIVIWVGVHFLQKWW